MPDITANDVDAERRRLDRQPPQFGLASVAVGRDLDEVLRRVAAERELREGNQRGTGLGGTPGGADDEARIAREIAYGGIDLTEGELHVLCQEGVLERSFPARPFRTRELFVR